LFFYNAFLTDVSDDKNAGRVSGFGFALGYIGGGLCLALNMVMMGKPAWFGLANADATLPVRASVSVAGVWWLLFSVPTVLWVKDRTPSTVKTPTPVSALLTGAIKQLIQSWKNMSRFKEVKRFLLSYLIFNDGIQTIILMASIFGAKELGMSTAQLALVYLVVQFVAFVGAMACGRLADSWSHKKVLLVTLVVYAALIVWAVFMRQVWEFWTMGVVIGLVLGGSQAAARSLFAVMIPPAHSGEFFALYGVVGKAASLLGPALFGAVSQVAGLRAGIASLMVFFLVGGFLLFTVDEESGRRLS
jgi:UMF1 family MFS transporter